MGKDWDPPDFVGRMLEAGNARQQSVALLAMGVFYGARILRGLLSDKVVYFLVTALVVLFIAMMHYLPPDQFIPVATSFSHIIRALGGVFLSNVFQLLGWFVAAVVLLGASAVFVVERHRRKKQDEELRRTRAQLDPYRSSSQMTIEEFLERRKE